MPLNNLNDLFKGQSPPHLQGRKTTKKEQSPEESSDEIRQPQYGQNPETVDDLFAQFAPQKTGEKENSRRSAILRSLSESVGSLGGLYAARMGAPVAQQDHGAREGIERHQQLKQNWEDQQRQHQLLQMQDAIRQRDTGRREDFQRQTTQGQQDFTRERDATQREWRLEDVEADRIHRTDYADTRHGMTMREIKARRAAQTTPTEQGLAIPTEQGFAIRGTDGQTIANVNDQMQTDIMHMARNFVRGLSERDELRDRIMSHAAGKKLIEGRTLSPDEKRRLVEDFWHIIPGVEQMIAPERVQQRQQFRQNYRQQVPGFSGAVQYRQQTQQNRQQTQQKDTDPLGIL